IISPCVMYPVYGMYYFDLTQPFFKESRVHPGYSSVGMDYVDLIIEDDFIQRLQIFCSEYFWKVYSLKTQSCSMNLIFKRSIRGGCNYGTEVLSIQILGK